MRHVSWQRKTRVLLVALAALAGFNGLAPEARAFQFSTGDLVLAVFGNSQEYYRDLGPASTLLAPGTLTPFDLNSSLLNPMSATAGPQPVSWTLLSTQGTTQTSTLINVASLLNTADTLASGSNNGVFAVRNNITSWMGTIGPATGPGTEIVLAASDPSSYTTRMGISGTMSGSFTGGGLQGSLGNVLTMIQGRALVSGQQNVLTDVGQAVLSAGGQLSICGGAGCSVAPVPVPAAVVLFGSGLIGLVGIARRKLMRNSTEA